ncbi:CynX/NimT family MFS transporter [Microbacterium sp. GXS0129]|uniref:MFS transporter n=1 Tax=Microbacterium sp. GXS0129 TaxID=3377836 RepID=UPI00383A59FE
MSSSAVRRSLPWLALAGVMVAALSMRSPIVAPTPVMSRITADFGIDAGTAGLLTTAPVLMFALMTPVAALVIRRRGAEFALMTTLVGVLIGTFVRGLPGFGWMLVGMIIIGGSITIGNVVAPVIIRREAPPARVATMTAAYTAMLNVGSLITSLATAPLASAIGWQWALMAWSGLTVIGILLWSAHMARRRAIVPAAADALPERDAVATITGPTPVVGAGSRQRVLRPITVLLMLAFGCQSAAYYALTTWLPTIGADRLGLDANAAGAMSSVFQGVAIIGAFLVPVLARYTPPLVPVIVVGATWVTTTLGLAVAPELMLLWMCVGAVAQAGGFVAIFAMMVQISRSDAEAAGMSALVQGVGYVISSLGAPLTGLLHDLSGGWTLPLWSLVGVTVAYAIMLIGAALTARRG